MRRSFLVAEDENELDDLLDDGSRRHLNSCLDVSIRRQIVMETLIIVAVACSQCQDVSPRSVSVSNRI